jgi:hypothetical protein
MTLGRTLRSALAMTALIAVAAPAAFAGADLRVTPTIKVTSTLKGRSVLPHRIRWFAHPTPGVRIKEVDFLIDGKLAWIERQAPYAYSESYGPHVGYLVTSWLAPGRHRFAVRAIALDGRKASTVVTARVRARPALPAGLAGTWQRTIADTSAAPPTGTADNPTDTYTPPGTYTMVIDKRQIQMRFPGTFHRPASEATGEGWILDSDYIIASQFLRATGPVAFEPFHAQAEGGTWCWQDGPSGDYEWTITGNTLTLTPRGGADPCGIRGFIWSGQWTRTG